MTKRLKTTLHTHEASASGDSHTPAEVMAAEYADRGFDVVGFVGHDARPDIDTDAMPVTAVAGIEREVETDPRRVHILDYPEYDFTALAHPRLSYPASTQTKTRMAVEAYGVDAVERFNRGRDELGEPVTVDSPLMAGDDAHSTHQVGGSYMVVEARSDDPSDVFEAIKRGRVELHNPGLRRRDYYAGRMHQGLALVGHRYG